MIHYPPVPPTAAAHSLRAAPHEDINAITLLCTATGPGLEVQQRDGSWLPVIAQPGQIIVDTGDMLQNLSNGIFKSTTHRVVTPLEEDEPSGLSPGDRSRFSLPFFVHPRPETDLSPRPNCIARSGGTPRYPSLTAGQYLQQRLAEIGLKS